MSVLVHIETPHFMNQNMPLILEIVIQNYMTGWCNLQSVGSKNWGHQVLVLVLAVPGVSAVC